MSELRTNVGIRDILNKGGVQGQLSVGTTAVEARVGSRKFEERKSLTVYNNSAVVLYWGYTDNVTTTTGMPILPKQFMEWTVSEDVAVYLIAATTSNNARITEAG